MDNISLFRPSVTQVCMKKVNNIYSCSVHRYFQQQQSTNYRHYSILQSTSIFIRFLFRSQIIHDSCLKWVEGMKVSGMRNSEFHSTLLALNFFFLVLLFSVVFFSSYNFWVYCWLDVVDGRCLSDWLSHSLSTSSLSISRKCLLSISEQFCIVSRFMYLSLSSFGNFIVRWRHCCCLDNYGNWNCSLCCLLAHFQFELFLFIQLDL